MRIDYQHGDHLRVGRFLIARARQSESGPIVDGGGTLLTRRDEGTLVDVLGNARHLVEGYQHAVDGAEWDATPEMIGTRHVNAEVRSLAESVRIAEEETVVEHFGAVVVHRPGRVNAVALGWLDARPPHPARWRPRFLLAHARWVLAGRPANVYLHESGQLRPKVFGGGMSMDQVNRAWWSEADQKWHTPGDSVEFIERSAL